MSNHSDDIRLIEEFTRGAHAAFNKIVLKYQDMVFNVCMKMLRDRNDALDVSQDVFVSLYRHLKEFRGDSLLSTYLYRICMNMCKNRLRSRARLRRNVAYSLDSPVEAAGGVMRREIDSGMPTPRDETSDKERRKIVRDTVDSLKTEYKEIVVLKEFEQLKYNEIAAILKIDIGTVKSRLARARAELRQKLKDYYEWM
ncbi:MAG: sigma-70 family RNA polymerase sigma factor [Candidatus Omnitrophica bacterium]|nr:sigma-70 family RNA polymerase sigma factor [Candidatus Omnitrophota bacterium]